MNITDYIKRKSVRVNQGLDSLLPSESAPPSEIHRAMRYSVFAGGKRLRPILTIATGEIFGIDERELLPTACAVEMIHTYSLIHDDLPAVDNDCLRRGHPTCHVKFGEALAIFAGDALLTQAFITLVDSGVSDPVKKVQVISEIALAAGTHKALIGGQALDIYYEGKQIEITQLNEIHAAKTGALICCAVRIGALIGGASQSELERLTKYGQKIGLAFQIVDDLLDETGTSATLGKSAGKDAVTQKATYVTLLGIDEAWRRAKQLCNEAIDEVGSISRDSSRLKGIARFIVERRS
ncbi:MAG: polyprenyl synthetase family protein [Blastocatellia bacterium]